jgi:hypothetical protein
VGGLTGGNGGGGREQGKSDTVNRMRIQNSDNKVMTGRRVKNEPNTMRAEAEVMRKHTQKGYGKVSADRKSICVQHG